MAECKFDISSKPGSSEEVKNWYDKNGPAVCAEIEAAERAIEEYNASVDLYNKAREGETLDTGGFFDTNFSPGWKTPGKQKSITFKSDAGLSANWNDIMTYTSFKTHGRLVEDPAGFVGLLKSNYEIARRLEDLGRRRGFFDEGPKLNAYQEILEDQSIKGGSAGSVSPTRWGGANNSAAKIQAAANNLKLLHEALIDVGAKAGAAKGLSDEDAALLDESGNIKDGLDEDQRAQAEDARQRLADEEIKAVTIHDNDHKTIVFKDQCFLLDHIFYLVQHKKFKVEPRQPKKLPYYPDLDGDNACLMIDGDPYGLINKLTQHQAQSAFFNMKTEEISSLQPMIRLFKVNYDPDDPTKEFQQEFLFDSYATRKDVESLFSDKSKRGFGVGIKNFSFTYDGNNPFAAKKSIKAKLTIFASSFDELLVDRGGYRYAELALKTGKAKKKPDTDNSSRCDKVKDEEKIEQNLAKLNFRLKAVIGFARPTGDTSIFTSMTEKTKRSVLDAINESYVTLNLTPTIHDFKIDDMGRVTFTCSYLAYVEDFFDQPQFDIFYDGEVTKRVFSRKMEYEDLSKKCSPSELGEWKKELADSGAVRQDKFKNMQSLMGRLRKNKKIKYINIPYASLPAIESSGPFFETPFVVTDDEMNHGAIESMLADVYLSTYVSSEAEEEEKPKTRFTNRQQNIQNKATARRENDKGPPQNISFFYVSDLLDIIFIGIEKRLATFSDAAVWEKKPFSQLDTAAKRREIEMYAKFHQQFKKFRTLLGPLEIVDPKDNTKVEFVNLGDIPVSTRYFMEWLSESMLKNEQVRYNLNKFLNDFFNNLVRNFLNNDTCFSFNTKQKTRLNQAAITSYKNKDNPHDEITKAILDRQFVSYTRPSRAVLKTLPKPVLNVSGPAGLPVAETGIQNEINYLCYFVGRTQPIEKMNGSREQDETNGIFHYMIGQPRGIVKTIDLTRAEAKYLKEVRFEQEGFDGLEQLREVYDVNIECYAQVKTYPGTYIYVDPRGFAPNTTHYSSTGKEEDAYLDLTRYGIGGYCMIIRSEHTFGPGQANTRITAKWVAQIEHEEEKRVCEAREEPTAGDGSKSNCPVNNREEAAATAEGGFLGLFFGD